MIKVLILGSNQNDTRGLIFKSVETHGSLLLSCTEKTYMMCCSLTFFKTRQRWQTPTPVCTFWQFTRHLAPVKTSLKSLSNFPLPGFSLSPQSQLLMEDMVNNVGHLKNAD